LLRVLRFDIRMALPHHYSMRYLARAMSSIAPSSTFIDRLDGDEREEADVVGVELTTVGGIVSVLTDASVRSSTLCCYFEPRCVAAACVWVAFEKVGFTDIIRQGVNGRAPSDSWVDEVTSGRVEVVDFDEAASLVRDLSI
jgi:hypothetical protein